MVQKCYEDMLEKEGAEAKAKKNAEGEGAARKSKEKLGAASGYDPQALAEKMKKFKFAKPASTQAKDPNWFKKFNEQGCNGADAKDDFGSADQVAQPVNPRTGLTKEDERRINREMIPHFKQQQEDLEPEFEQLRHVRQELKQLQQEYGCEVRQVQPKATTSFMTRRGSQAKQYEMITSQMRHNRLQR